MFLSVPTRFVIAAMIGLGALVHAIVRSSFTMAWLANASVHAPSFDSGLEQGLVLGGYAFGRMAAVLPLTHWLIARRQGRRHRRTKSGVFYAMLLTAGVLAVQPTLVENVAVVESAVWLLMASRMLIGALQALIMPALLELLAAWLPTSEMHPFSLLFACHNVGSALTFVATGAAVQLSCCSLAFYTPAAICVVFAIGWLFLVFDAPANHPRISVAERIYIASSDDPATISPPPDAIGNGSRQFWPSLRRVWLSPTFWAVLLLHAGNAWGSNATLTAIPLLCHYVFKLGVPATAAWMASMYAGRTVFGLLFGQVVERVMAAKWMGKTTLRKLSCVFSHTLPGIALLAATVCDEQRPNVCLACIALGFWLNGAVAKTAYDNLRDLSARHHGAIFAMCDCVSSCLGGLSPLVVVLFVGSAECTTLFDWLPFLRIMAGMYIVPSALYQVCGSAVEQPWSRNALLSEAENPRPVMLKIRRKSIHKEMYF